MAAAQLQCGFGVGVNAFQTKLDHGNDSTPQLLPIYTISGHIVFRYHVGSEIFLGSELSVVQKGAQEDLKDVELRYNATHKNSQVKIDRKSFNKSRTTYLQVPLTIEKKIAKGSVWAGGYVGMALVGRQYSELYQTYIEYGTATTVSIAQEEKIKPVTGPVESEFYRTYCKRYDAGIQLGATYFVRENILLSFNYSRGLVNTVPSIIKNGETYAPVYKEFNRGFGVKIIFLLSNKEV